MPADIVVYDLEKLELEPQYKTYDYPANEWRLTQKAKGYHWTLINGVVTFEGNECTGATAGQLLRHGRAGAGAQGKSGESASKDMHMMGAH